MRKRKKSVPNSGKKERKKEILYRIKQKKGRKKERQKENFCRKRKN